MQKSTVYLTGAGPGDAKLITVKALELIKRADCVIYDYLANPDLLKFAGEKCKVIYVGKKGSAHTLPQAKINRLLVSSAKKYKTVVRLKGGDPFIFGRGAEEAVFLKKHKINFEIVPGVTSAIAVPAYAGIPLTARAHNSSVGFITGHEDPGKEKSNIDWQALARGLGTLVFLMGVGNLASITKKLITAGKDKSTPVAVIRWGTTTEQKTIVGNLGNIAGLVKKNKIKPPAITVVGEVVGLRKELSWFEKKPLLGKRVVVTRARHQASILSEKLGELGADVVESPAINIVSLKADGAVEKALLGEKYDWVFFTSQNGVYEFAEILDRIKKDTRLLSQVKICAIGSETAKSLNKIGIKPDYVPNRFYAEEIIKHFESARFRNLRALILRAKKARDVLPQGLRDAGMLVKIIDLYDTCIDEEAKSLVKKAFGEKVDWVTFTSSSTVENFIKLLGNDYRKKLIKVKLASIGPITSQALRRFGLKPHAEAKVYTIDGLIEAIVKSRGKG
ncbi:MAG: uroporphyrinogen-III C-methyltransferase [Candidatus Omnitrophica bacterium CG11_big_fil_rev_8_21_14_0_20_42_13]|uniref:uroporphyrinogen-III C-methyltransferase n=1 Tax=Candidatus Ghiorseimicrobium undicola TaxID=1974746 RepID=A0A2H0LYR2_9BACT|nr:MAG: uroporphyrinogen-III C-methyltransferase [Candidatus Omnitrophica bacterium CG11_big_fil_rev_8_21_14_0_20_42_13]